MSKFEKKIDDRDYMFDLLDTVFERKKVTWGYLDETEDGEFTFVDLEDGEDYEGDMAVIELLEEMDILETDCNLEEIQIINEFALKIGYPNKPFDESAWK